MALATGVLTKLKQLHGEPYLIDVTNPEVDGATSIVEAVLETAIELRIERFNRRGYAFDNENIAVLNYCVLDATPRTIWDGHLQANFSCETP